MSERCRECGTVQPDGKTCQDDFHQMLFWEAEVPARGEVHHLTVLCYHLQHPSLYSPDGLIGALGLLVDFVARGISPASVRQRDRQKVNSNNRDWKIKASADSAGYYAHAIQWTMTAPDVVAGGADAYCENVRAWARSVLEVLKASGEVPSDGET